MPTLSTAKLCSEHRCSDPSCCFGEMMRKLDQRGVAALEFCLVAVPLFILMFAIFDLGRYAITMQSLRMLANAGARAMMIMLHTCNAIITYLWLYR